MNNSALESATLRVQAEQIADLYQPNGGRPAITSDADKVQVFLAALTDGNYRETALKLAGIAKQTYYNTLKRAEAGDESAIAFVDAVEKAEALAECQSVRNVRNAGKFPQFWASEMTYLERKHPERWGRRQDEQSAPKVVVNIGVRDSDVQVQVVSPPVTRELEAISTGQVMHASPIIGDYVNQPADSEALAIPDSGARVRCGTPADTGAPSRPRVNAALKGKSLRTKKKEAAG